VKFHDKVLSPTNGHLKNPTAARGYHKQSAPLASAEQHRDCAQPGSPMMSVIFPRGQFEKCLAALSLVLCVFLSKPFTGEAKWTTPAKTGVLSTLFDRLSLALRIDPSQ
jgi:hypothetical protein